MAFVSVDNKPSGHETFSMKKKTKTAIRRVVEGNRVEILVELTEKEKRFAEEYVVDFNNTRAATAAGYSAASPAALRVKASSVRSKPAVKQYIKELQSNLAEFSGISQMRILQEYAKIAFASFGDYLKSWMTMKEFEELSDIQRAAIAEVTAAKKDGIEGVRIKLHDKIRALDSISRMLGFDAPVKLDLGVLPGQLLPPIIHVHNVGPPMADNEADIKD